MDGWERSWRAATDWFSAYSSQDGFEWAAFFAPLLTEVAHTDAARGLFVHRWATTAVVSRYSTEPDWGEGPKLEIQPLPGRRVEVRVFDAYQQHLHRHVLQVPVADRAIELWLRFVAGEISAAELAAVEEMAESTGGRTTRG